MIKPTLILVSLVIYGVVCPPPMRQQAEQAQAHDQAQQVQDNQINQEEAPRPAYEFTYQRYLEEVVNILESDPAFSQKMKNMKEEEIKSGNIADHIEDLPKEVFDQLHAVKMKEIERIRTQLTQQIKEDGGTHNIVMPDHLDVQITDKFHKEDLRKLVLKVVSDMENLDKQKHADYKKHEMEQQAQQDHRLAQMTPEERAKAKLEIEAAEKRHNDHEKLKHPGSRDQLEEVWEDSDHLDKESFDPKTFFALHDLNGDGYWNDMELETLFVKELDKMYNETNPDDDPRERQEEMLKMREHVAKQMDKNGDRLISLEEFLSDTEANTPNQDQGWEDLSEKKPYTDEELQAFEKEYALKEGWGENAYLGAEVVIPPAGSENVHPNPQADQIHQQPIQNPPPVQQQVDPAQQRHPAVPPQAVQNAQPPVQQQPIHHAPIQDHKMDSAYGV